MAHAKLTKMVAALTVAGALAIAAPSVASANGQSNDDQGQGSVESTSSSGNVKRDDGERSNFDGDKQRNGQGSAKAKQLTRDKCLKEIDRRLEEIDELLAKVADDDTATPAHKIALTAILNSAKTGLATLRAKIEADTDPTQLQADCQSIFTDFRIYALRVPQVNLVLAADRALAQQTKFASLKTKLQQAIADATTAGNPNVTRAQDLLTDFDAKVAAGLAEATGVADAVILLTPADWNANHDVLKPFITKLRNVRSDFRAASKDARQILALLSGEGEHLGIDKVKEKSSDD